MHGTDESCVLRSMGLLVIENPMVARLAYDMAAAMYWSPSRQSVCVSWEWTFAATAFQVRDCGELCLTMVSLDTSNDGKDSSLCV